MNRDHITKGAYLTSAPPSRGDKSPAQLWAEIQAMSQRVEAVLADAREATARPRTL